MVASRASAAPVTLFTAPVAVATMVVAPVTVGLLIAMIPGRAVSLADAFFDYVFATMLIGYVSFYPATSYTMGEISAVMFFSAVVVMAR